MEPIDLLRLAAETLDRLGLDYAIRGSMASMTFGEPRFTNDIDIGVRLPRHRVDEFCRQFPVPEFYVSAEAARDAVRAQGMFNVIHPSSGLKIDIIIAKSTPLGRAQLERGQRVRLSDDFSSAPRFLSPEDIILSKLEFFRAGQPDKHLRDIAGIIKTMGDKLESEYIERSAATLSVKDIWDAIIEKVDG